jgi:molybdenum cofactor synthesis domain-containing protein
MAQPIEIICVGNELLIGKTLNTNAQWLAKRITALGLSARRITIVGDDVDEIFSAIREAMQRNPRFLITTGGLGPTFDDKTLEGLAKALECKLEINEEALTMVKEKYRKYAEEGKMKKAELTPPRAKMAKLPEGAKPLSNPVGTAPGVIMKRGSITILALPGVPSEMKAIFDGSVASLLKQVAGDDPKGAERIPRIEFHFSTTAKKSGVARKRVSNAFVQLSELIQEKGGKIKPSKTES